MEETTTREQVLNTVSEELAVPSAQAESAAQEAPKAGESGGRWQKFKKSWKKDLKTNWPVYLLFLPVLAWLLIVHYIPMVGILLAWKDYDVWDGIWGSQWVGWQNFEQLFTGGGTGSLDFLYALRRGNVGQREGQIHQCLQLLCLVSRIERERILHLQQGFSVKVRPQPARIRKRARIQRLPVCLYFDMQKGGETVLVSLFKGDAEVSFLSLQRVFARPALAGQHVLRLKGEGCALPKVDVRGLP